MTQNIQVSKKLDDGTIIVIAGHDWPEFQGNLLELVGDELYLDVIDQFKLLAPASGGGTNNYQKEPDYRGNPSASNGATQGYSRPTGQQPRTGGGTPPGQAAPFCAHGPMVWKEGQGQRGPWKAWMCSGPRGGDRCEAQFIH